MRLKFVCILLILFSILAPDTYADITKFGDSSNTSKRLEIPKVKTKKVKKAEPKNPNPSKTLALKGFAGFKFGAKGGSNGLPLSGEATILLKRAYFSRYTQACIKVSPSLGVCSIGVISTDPAISTRDDIQNEMKRMIGLFAAKFKAPLYNEIVYSNNAEIGTGQEFYHKADSITGGLRRGYGSIGVRQVHTITKAATAHYYTLNEDFADCRVKVFGKYEDGKCQTSFTIELKIQ